MELRFPASLGKIPRSFMTGFYVKGIMPTLSHFKKGGEYGDIRKISGWLRWGMSW